MEINIRVSTRSGNISVYIKCVYIYICIYIYIYICMYIYIYMCVPLFFIYLFIYKSNSLVDLIYLTYLSIYLFIYTSYPKGIHFCGFKCGTPRIHGSIGHSLSSQWYNTNLPQANPGYQSNSHDPPHGRTTVESSTS